MADRPARLIQMAPKRGQPLVFLATVVLLWVSARAVHHLMPAEAILPQPSAEHPLLPGVIVEAATLRLQPARQGVAALLGLQAHAAVRDTGDRKRGQARARQAAMPVEIALSHQRMWVESMTGGGFSGPGGQGSPLVDRPLHMAAPAAAATTVLSYPSRRKRWSVYGWSLVRQGSQPPALAAAGQYGGSQAGLVVRLALGREATSPAIYARATSALASAGDRSLAIGMSAQPWPGVPVDLAVERRLGPGAGQRDRFAAMLVGGGSVVDQRSGVQFDGYGQAGVIGLNNPRGFFDLQMLASRNVTSADRGTLSVGAGLWAGGQQNVEADGDKRWLHRVDIGPRAAVTLPVDKSRMTLALDWRQRVDGDASPPSGAAITLSAGF